MDDKELLVKGNPFTNQNIFKLNYRNIQEAKEIIQKKWSLLRVIFGYVFFEKEGGLIIGKKKQKGLELIVCVQNSENDLIISIVFSKVFNLSQAVFNINKKIMRAKGINL